LNILALDTSTTSCSVALTIGDRLAAETILSLERTHASMLLRVVDSLLAAAGLELKDIDGFAAAIGPGSFTGLRVGVATVKGLALATGKPVCGFSSLAMLAMNISGASYPVCPMFDARKKEVYAALYDCRGLPVPIIEDCVVAPGELLERLDETTIFVGEGAIAYRDQIVGRMGEKAIFAPFPLNLPRASCGAVLAGIAFAEGKGITPAALLPRYIRPSEAELARAKRL
jgi:tRNA threonylcarbamoyladenosine biosynthesis protein TsaB